MTAQASLQSAMQAVNEGAFYYIQKPFRNDELLAILRRALEHAEHGESKRTTERLQMILASFGVRGHGLGRTADLHGWDGTIRTCCVAADAIDLLWNGEVEWFKEYPIFNEEYRELEPVTVCGAMIQGGRLDPIELGLRDRFFEFFPESARPLLEQFAFLNTEAIDIRMTGGWTMEGKRDRLLVVAEPIGAKADNEEYGIGLPSMCIFISEKNPNFYAYLGSQDMVNLGPDFEFALSVLMNPDSLESLEEIVLIDG